MSEENPPTDEIDDAWLKRRENWCAPLINKNTTAGYTAEMMFAMCARIRADGKRIERLEKAAKEFREAAWDYAMNANAAKFMPALRTFDAALSALAPNVLREDDGK